MFLFLPSCLSPHLSPSPPPTSHPSQLPQHVSEGGTFGPDTVTDAVQRMVSFPPSPPLTNPLFLSFSFHSSSLTPSPLTPSQGEQPATERGEVSWLGPEGARVGGMAADTPPTGSCRDRYTLLVSSLCTLKLCVCRRAERNHYHLLPLFSLLGTPS